MKYYQLVYRSRMVAFGVSHDKGLKERQQIHCNNTNKVGVEMKNGEMASTFPLLNVELYTSRRISRARALAPTTRQVTSLR